MVRSLADGADDDGWVEPPSWKWKLPDARDVYLPREVRDALVPLWPPKADAGTVAAPGLAR